jgi:HD superfamily phosphohydrolase
MSTKIFHEIRDSVHGFITIDTPERDVLDSPPVQRLRHIHQLAMGYLVYPGATHKRFEHALGVMELADRAYDVITRTDHVREQVRNLFQEVGNEDQRRYWRRVVRMAALCHDIGHLPFSHAAEEDLFPEEFKHEHMTAALINSNELRQIWESLVPPLTTDHIMKLSVGKRYLPEMSFSPWEELLSEIIVGDAFGVDRMDYLLRDSLHIGVQYGRFDHNRLIDSLRILPTTDYSTDSTTIPPATLGLEEGGIQSAEALSLARYQMFSQVYLHPVRRAYDLHLQDFLHGWLPGGKFTTQPPEFLEYSDIEVLAAIRKESKNGSDAAMRIANRQHFKVAYSRNPGDQRSNIEASEYIYQSLAQKFGTDKVKLDSYEPSGSVIDFPVLQPDMRIVSSTGHSDLLQRIPTAAIGFVFVEPSIRPTAREFIRVHRESILNGA